MDITLQTVIKTCNKTPKVKLKRLMAVKKYYLSMYRANMVRLYSLAYIGDPTRYNEQEIKKNLIDMGIISNLTFYTGAVVISSDNVKFAMYKNRGNVEAYQFLSILYQVLRYKELSEKVDVIYEEYNFSGCDSAKVKVHMLQKGAMIIQKTGIDFDEAMARVISPFEKETKVVSFNDSLWDMCMECLGIPEEDWHSDGLFDACLSHEEEVECAEGILNGCYHIDGGKYKKELETWLMSHRWSDKAKFLADTKGLYDFIYCEKSNEVESLFNQRLNEINGEILAVHKDRVYYNTERKGIELPVGVFTVLCKEDLGEDILSTGNSVYGYTGEVYTEKRLVEDETDYVGCPIAVSVSSSKVEYVYDVEQTGIQSGTWFAEEGMCIDFSEEDAEALPVNPFVLDSLEYRLYDAYKNSLTSEEYLTFFINGNISDADLISAYKKVYKVLEGI